MNDVHFGESGTKILEGIFKGNTTWLL